jgi:hypothetical protein
LNTFELLEEGFRAVLGFINIVLKSDYLIKFVLLRVNINNNRTTLSLSSSPPQPPLKDNKPMLLESLEILNESFKPFIHFYSKVSEKKLRFTSRPRSPEKNWFTPRLNLI